MVCQYAAALCTYLRKIEKSGTGYNLLFVMCSLPLCSLLYEYGKKLRNIIALC